MVDNIWSGFGRLGRGMSSALVGSGYGCDGSVVGLWGGVFSSGCLVWRVWSVCLWHARRESGEWIVGLGCGGVGGLGSEGEKNSTTLWLLLNLRILGGSEFCFKN